jgi:AraC-like DNA-binding protein
MIQYTFFPPDPLLSGYILSYGLMELPAGIVSPLLSPPNGVTGFVIRIKSDPLGDVRARDFRGNPIAYQTSYAIGQTTFPITGHIAGESSFMMVFFHPLALYSFFGYDMNRLTNATVDLADFLGVDRYTTLMNDLGQAEEMPDKTEVLNKFFLKQLPEVRKCDLTQSALALIHEAEGNIRIKTLEGTLQTSRRTLERYFNSKVGISPKVYAQIFRFKCAMNFLKSNPKTTWAGLTYNNGFFDQPHLIRYFKEYLKVSPNNLVTLDVDFINYLLKS